MPIQKLKKTDMEMSADGFDSTMYTFTLIVCFVLFSVPALRWKGGYILMVLGDGLLHGDCYVIRIVQGWNRLWVYVNKW